ncbi:hypothetical protein [Scytonema sp. PCC 10023]|uniref:hypothetical protein n=1 Tax=Scytonema sp. PCC 10023 TaxID=1680591 RepID=UPI0039C5B524
MNIFWKGTIVLTAFLTSVLPGYRKLPDTTTNMASEWASADKVQVSASAIASKTTSNLRVYLRDDGTVMVNNQPFFPFGFYHDSQKSPDWRTTNSKRLNHLKEIAAAGFNIIHPEIGGNYESDKVFLGVAEKLGVRVLPNFSYNSRLEIINKYKKEPIIIGWDIADDVDHPNNKFTPKMISNWHTEVKNADPSRITYVTAAFPKRVNQFINVSDIVGFQSYPIDNDPNVTKPLRSSYYTIQSAFQDEKGNFYNRPIIALLQTFPWKNKPPKFHEVRNMTYSALINGVKGIIYYSYFFDGWELSQQKDLWNGMKSLAPEIKNLSPVLLNGSFTKIDTKVDDLFAGQWIYGNNVYVVVLSTSPTKTIEASITIPAKVTGSAQPLFSERPSGMVFKKDKLNGLIKPGDVHVYKILNNSKK